MLRTQVLQEFYVNITTKIPTPLAPSTARELVNSYRAWQLEIIEGDTIVAASEVGERNRISFWDAMIVAAASRAGAAVIITEDLNHGQMIEGVRIENPFRRSG